MTKSTALDRWLVKAVGPESKQTNRDASEASDNQQQQELIAQEDQSILVQKQITTRRALHANVQISNPQKGHIAALKRLNSLLLPINYPDSFYKEIISDPVANSITLLAHWQEPADQPPQLIGAIRCRLLNTPEGSPRNTGPQLYVSTLGVLSPYRHLGIASHLLNAVIQTASQEYDASSVIVHVWEANTDALEWYLKRGFKEIQFLPDYYGKLKPHGARIMLKDIGVLDLV